MPSKTGIVFNERFLEHDTGPAHPERADRLRALVKHLMDVKLWRELQHLLIDEAPLEWITQVHSPEYVRFIREACRRDAKILDQGDTHASRQSYDVALLAAGGVMAAVDAVMNGVLKNAFCAVRPPGHHALKNAAMGFCIFNNIAIGANYAIKNYHTKRIAIIDWDVHHGNGTQDAFYETREVFFVSLHQYPFYPGSGSRAESGHGEGAGYTLNFPMWAGAGDNEYLEAFSEEILPALENYRPELIMISAGFDAHKNDPLANINLTEESFSTFTKMLNEAALRHCGGKIISVLEGGYNLSSLSTCVEAHLRQLLA